MNEEILKKCNYNPYRHIKDFYHGCLNGDAFKYIKEDGSFIRITCPECKGIGFIGTLPNYLLSEKEALTKTLESLTFFDVNKERVTKALLKQISETINVIKNGELRK